MNAQATAAAAALHHAIPRQARPRRAAAPALPPLDRLDHTHQQMVDMLAQLVQLVTHLEAEGVDEAARSTAKAICRFFSDAARKHHADEETLVFPALIQQGNPALLSHVLRLQQDHGWLEEDWLELSPQLQAVAEGYSWYDLDGLRQAAAVFTALYQEHIALEESLIYPEARRLMAAGPSAPAR
jgi:hemerythrin-like domain-containing protein